MLFFCAEKRGREHGSKQNSRYYRRNWWGYHKTDNSTKRCQFGNKVHTGTASRCGKTAKT